MMRLSWVGVPLKVVPRMRECDKVQLERMSHAQQPLDLHVCVHVCTCSVRLPPQTGNASVYVATSNNVPY